MWAFWFDAVGKASAEDVSSEKAARRKPGAHTLTHAAGRKLTTLHKHKVLGYYGGALQIDESPGGVTAAGDI